MDIKDIDKNFAAVEKEDENVEWYDVLSSQGDLYGCFDKERYLRFDTDFARTINERLEWLAVCTAGIRYRFSTDSPFIKLYAELTYDSIYPNMPLTGASGFDLYTDLENDSIFSFSYRPDNNSAPVKGEALVHELPFYVADKLMNYTLNFPLYNGVKYVKIGIKKGCTLFAGNSYEPGKKIVYYGSSITQGGCASRPGMCYQNIIARRNNIDYLNLGFSGNGRGEIPVAEYIANLDMSMYVSDYDFNAPTKEHLVKTLLPFTEVIRDKHPDIPIIMLSHPSIYDHPFRTWRHGVVEDAYNEFVKRGDKNIYFISGETLFDGKNNTDCTIDGVHPSDLGFFRMAEKIYDVMKGIKQC